MMTDKRIAELRRCNTMHYSTTTGGMQQGGWSAELTECLDEIERLKADHASLLAAARQLLLACRDVMDTPWRELVVSVMEDEIARIERSSDDD